MLRQKPLVVALTAVLTLAFVAELTLVGYTARRIHLLVRDGQAVTLVRAGTIAARSLASAGARQLAVLPARVLAGTLGATAVPGRVAETSRPDEPTAVPSQTDCGEPDVITHTTCPILRQSIHVVCVERARPPRTEEDSI